MPQISQWENSRRINFKIETDKMCMASDCDFISFIKIISWNLSLFFYTDKKTINWNKYHVMPTYPTISFELHSIERNGETGEQCDHLYNDLTIHIVLNLNMSYIFVGLNKYILFFQFMFLFSCRGDNKWQ